MNQMSKVVGLFAIAAALSACGGGGDGGGSTATTGTSATGGGTGGSGGTGPTPPPPPPPPPPPATTHSADDIQTVAALGLNVELWTGDMALMNFLGNLIDSYGHVTPTPARCSSGTVTTDVTKAGVYQGLQVGDSLTITLAQCVLVTDGRTMDGTVILTARELLRSNEYFSSAAKFGFETAGLSITNKQGTRQYKGALDIARSSATVDTDGSFVVPAGKTFTYSTTIASTPVTLAFDAGASFSQSDHPFDANSRKLDGSVSVTLGSTAAWPLVIATPTALSDKDLVDFQIQAGTVNTTLTDESLATSTTVTGANAVISGDSDGNGSLDLVVNTTRLALVGY